MDWERYYISPIRSAPQARTEEGNPSTYQPSNPATVTTVALSWSPMASTATATTPRA